MSRCISLFAFSIISAFALVLSTGCDDSANGETPLLDRPEIASPPPVADVFCPDNVVAIWPDLDSLERQSQMQHSAINPILVNIFNGAHAFVYGVNDSLLLDFTTADLCQAPFYAELLVRILENEIPIYASEEKESALDAASTVGTELVGFCINNPEYLVNMLNHSERYWQPLFTAFVTHFYHWKTGKYYRARRNFYYGTMSDFDAFVREHATFGSQEELAKWRDFVGEVNVGVNMALEGF
jgi:hypothetical protein